MTGRVASGNLLVYFGKQLRRLRNEAGLTQEQVGEKIGYSAALVGMVETARRVPSYQFAACTDHLLDGRGVLEGLWMPIHEQGAPYQRLEDFAEVEARATAIDTYDGYVIPGLLQTEQYARALLSTARPRLTAGETEKRAATRLTRQRVFAKPAPPRYWAILGEAALHQQRGDDTVMRDQLHHLLAHAESHLITLQVLPFSAPDPGLGLSFSVLSFDHEAPVVYLDTFPTGLYHNSRTDVVSRCQAMFDYLREAAMSEDRSLDLVGRQVGELGG